MITQHFKVKRIKDDLADAGIYVLLVHVRGKAAISAGALGRLELRGGYYAYVGRASRGLTARISRHARGKGKRLHWHIDYLLDSARLREIWIYPLSAGECELAARLEAAGASREGLRCFGSSDCRCSGHLLYMGTKKPEPLQEPIVVIREPGCRV